MIKKAEIYSNHRFISKIKIHKQHEENIITVIPFNRNDFLFFYPNETLSVHYMDDSGTVFIYHVLFQEIKLIRTKAYYIFEINETEVFHHLKNKPGQKANLQALLSNFNAKQIVSVIGFFDSNIKIESLSPLEKGFVEMFYYLGKNKFSLLGEIVQETNDSDKHLYDLIIHRSEVI